MYPIVSFQYLHQYRNVGNSNLIRYLVSNPNYYFTLNYFGYVFIGKLFEPTLTGHSLNYTDNMILPDVKLPRYIVKLNDP